MIAGPASTLAHEMGHNLGFDHDEDITPCACDDPSCIMSAVIRSVRLAIEPLSLSLFQSVKL